MARQPPDVVCRADRNTGEMLAKNCDSYLYHDIFCKILYFLKIFCTAQL